MSKNEKVEVVMPSEIVLKHDTGPNDQATLEQAQREQSKVKGALFLDKLRQEKIIKTQQPTLAKLDISLARRGLKLGTLAKALVKKLKPKVIAAKALAALKALGMDGIVATISFGGTCTDKEQVEYSLKLNRKNETGYNNYGFSTTKELPFSAAMKQECIAIKKLETEIKATRDLILDAQIKLRDRANRMSDAEGALALKNMDSKDKQDVKNLFENMDGGLTTQKLLGMGQ